MSYDFSVWLPRRKVSRSEAASIHMALCNGELPDLLRPTPGVAAFISEIIATYPEIDDYEDDDIDDCPWSSAFDTSDSHAVLTCSYSRIEEIDRLLRAASSRHGLVLYNPQTGEISYPPAIDAGSSNPWWRIFRGGR